MNSINKILENKTVMNIIITALCVILIFIVSLIFNEYNYKNAPAANTDPVIISGGEVTDEITVDVKGAVRNPGIVKLKRGSRVNDAIELAGGMTEIADTASVNIAKILSEGEMVYVYRLPDQTETGTTPAPAEPSFRTTSSKSTSSSAAKTPKPAPTPKPTPTPKPEPHNIDINTATAEELELLPKIGPVIAQRIIDYRNNNNGFDSIEEIKSVNGIGDAIFAQIKDFIIVSSLSEIEQQASPDENASYGENQPSEEIQPPEESPSYEPTEAPEDNIESSAE